VVLVNLIDAPSGRTDAGPRNFPRFGETGATADALKLLHD
jgi:hypothetical protein